MVCCTARWPDEVIHLSGDLLADGVGDVLAPGRHLSAGPAHQRHHGPGRSVEEQQHGRGRMSRVVQPGLGQPGVPEQPLPFAEIGVAFSGAMGYGPACLSLARILSASGWDGASSP